MRVQSFESIQIECTNMVDYGRAPPRAHSVIPGSLRARLIMDAQRSARLFRQKRDAQLYFARVMRDAGALESALVELTRARRSHRALIGCIREIAKLEGRS